MSNVTPLRASDLTPSMVLSKALEVPDVRTAYVILVRHDGSYDIRASGDLKDIAPAALTFLDLATDCTVNGVSHD